MTVRPPEPPPAPAVVVLDAEGNRVATNRWAHLAGEEDEQKDSAIFERDERGER